MATKPTKSIEDAESLTLTQLSTPSATYNIPIKSVESEAASTSHQPRIDPLPNQTYVTAKDRLGLEPAWIDCDFCESCTKTRVQRTKLSNGNEDVIALLLCLVCPCLVCLAYNDDAGEEVNHYCTGDGCGAKVTYKHPSRPIQVLKPEGPKIEVSKYGLAS